MEIDLSSTSAPPTVKVRSHAQPQKRSAQLQCLIASKSKTRQQTLAHGADRNGWQTIVCSDTPTALACAWRTLPQLAFVDLEGPENDGFRSLVEHLATQPHVLLVICGNAGDRSEEIWARELGAWLYLPAMQEEPCAQVVCREARELAQRLRLAKRPAKLGNRDVRRGRSSVYFFG